MYCYSPVLIWKRRSAQKPSNVFAREVDIGVHVWVCRGAFYSILMQWFITFHGRKINFIFVTGYAISTNRCTLFPHRFMWSKSFSKFRVCVCVILNNQLNKIYIPLTTPVSLIHTLSFLLLPHQIYSSIILDWSFLYCHRMLAVLVYRIRDIRMNDFIILNPNTTL